MNQKLNSLEGLYIDMLKDLYSAEQQITKALPQMAKKAHTPELRQAFDEHLGQTENQIARLEQIFSSLKGSPRGKKCAGMEGIIKEGEEMMKESIDPEVLDAALIAAAQKVEHYEISCYGTARTYAQTLGHHDAVTLLQQSLEEESATDEKLSTLAENFVNAEAVAQ